MGQYSQAIEHLFAIARYLATNPFWRQHAEVTVLSDKIPALFVPGQATLLLPAIGHPRLRDLGWRQAHPCLPLRWVDTGAPLSELDVSVLCSDDYGVGQLCTVAEAIHAVMPADKGDAFRKRTIEHWRAAAATFEQWADRLPALERLMSEYLPEFEHEGFEIWYRIHQRYYHLHWVLDQDWDEQAFPFRVIWVSSLGRSLLSNRANIEINIKGSPLLNSMEVVQSLYQMALLHTCQQAVMQTVMDLRRHLGTRQALDAHDLELICQFWLDAAVPELHELIDPALESAQPGISYRRMRNLLQDVLAVTLPQRLPGIIELWLRRNNRPVPFTLPLAETFRHLGHRESDQAFDDEQLAEGESFMI